MKHTLTIPYEAPHVHQLDSPICTVCGKPVIPIALGEHTAYWHMAASEANDAPDPYDYEGPAFIRKEDNYAWFSCTPECPGELNLSAVDARQHGVWMCNKSLEMRHAGRGERELKEVA